MRMILNAIYYLNDKKGLRDLPLTKVREFSQKLFGLSCSKFLPERDKKQT